jgi:hypothetical protein
MNTRPARSFYDGPTIRVALHLLANADTNGHVTAIDQDVADATSMHVKDYRQILRRLEAAGMLTRQLHQPGRRTQLTARHLELHADAPAWRGVHAWLDLHAAEDLVQRQLGVAPGR